MITHTIEHHDPSESAFPEANGLPLLAQGRVIAKRLNDLPRDRHGQVDESAFSLGGWDHVFVAQVMAAIVGKAEVGGWGKPDA